MRYFVEISYNGSSFHGWQIQSNAVTVQHELNEALSKVLGQQVTTVGSGRTDTGVHAIMQVAHFDVQESISNDIIYKLNGILPESIAINRIYEVEPDVSARFDAESRAYEYRIHRHKDPFTSKASYFFSRDVDIKQMNKGCELLMKSSDFQSFSKVHTDVNNYICEIHEAEWTLSNGQLLFFVRANRFLRGMVRAIVGTLLDLGENKITIQELEQIIKGKDRKLAGRSVPPHGLYLCKIEYPKSIRKNTNTVN